MVVFRIASTTAANVPAFCIASHGTFVLHSKSNTGGFKKPEKRDIQLGKQNIFSKSDEDLRSELLRDQYKKKRYEK